jgi:hypothetical protein
MPQEKQCRASVVGCKELPQRDGSRMDSICLSMGNVACLCIPLHEVCRLMWKNWVFYTYGVYCSHSTLLWQNILETLMYTNESGSEERGDCDQSVEDDHHQG